MQLPADGVSILGRTLSGPGDNPGIHQARLGDSYVKERITSFS